MQYHTFVRQRDQEMLRRLLLARDTLVRIRADDCVSRCKVTEVVSLLCNTAQQVQHWTPDREGSNGIRATPADERGDPMEQQNGAGLPAPASGDLQDQAAFDASLADLWGAAPGNGAFDMAGAPNFLLDFESWNDFFHAPVDGLSLPM